MEDVPKLGIGYWRCHVQHDRHVWGGAKRSPISACITSQVRGLSCRAQQSFSRPETSIAFVAPKSDISRGNYTAFDIDRGEPLLFPGLNAPLSIAD